MTVGFLASAMAAILAALLACAMFVRRRHSLAGWCFVAGMLGLAAESFCAARAYGARNMLELLHWETLGMDARCVLPVTWLGFSIAYSRGNYAEFLRRWWPVLGCAALLPLVAVGAPGGLLLWIPRQMELSRFAWLRSTGAGKLLDVTLIAALVLILMNLEKTFRAAVGTMRWRIKFVILGLAIIFGARIYTEGETLLFSGRSLSLAGLESCSLIVGAILVGMGLARSGLSEIEIYPSQAILENSVTVLLAGAYLFIVGVLAQIAAARGGAGYFQLEALLVLAGIALLAVLIFSDRLRLGIRNFVGRHLRGSQHDVRGMWTLFTKCVSSEHDSPGLCKASARLISESFRALSVTIWLLDAAAERLDVGASTAAGEGMPVHSGASIPVPAAFPRDLRSGSAPVDLESLGSEWAGPLRAATPAQFRNGGSRLAVPLVSGEEVLGIAVLADRVNGVPYSVEELDLLKCIADQLAAALLNVRLSERLAHGRELEAFQTMSAFFVHDLKNAASSLGLMLKNLPVHFDDPAFRADALRGISSAAGRINQLISRLCVFRSRLDLKLAETDLNQVVAHALESLSGFPHVEVRKTLHPLPAIAADAEQLQVVFTNLFLNAAEAVGEAGCIVIETEQRDGRAVVRVADDGCGMPEQFLRSALFRPFQTTKKRGTGIGMFQSKMIVEAHRGAIVVRSEEGKGTTFEVSLPLAVTI